MGVFRFWFPGQTGVNLADGILHAEHGEEAVKQKRQQQGREQETQANDDAGRDLPEVIKLRNQIPDGGDPQVNMPCTRRFIIQADFIAVFAEDVARGWIFSIFVNLLIVSHKAFGDAAKNLVVNSTKSMIGHLLGAAGGVEFVTCVKSLEDGFIHQTVGTTEPDEECDLNYAIGAPIDKEIRYAMSNSLGFGGHNATLLVKKYEG